MIAPKPFYKSPNKSYGFRRCCEAIRDAVPIEEVARRYTKLEPCGGKAWFTGRCPLSQHEVHCGDHRELWEAMVSLALEYGVELPSRTKAWHEAQGRRVTYLNWAYEVIGEELSRRVFKVSVLPFIDAIIDQREREQALERAWDRWQRKSWKTIAESIAREMRA
jgi:hypothetical protein